MKFIAALTFVSMAAALDLTHIMGITPGIASQAKCVGPDLAEKINSLQVGDTGAVVTVCNNLDDIVKDLAGVTDGCGVDAFTIDRATKYVGELCARSGLL